MGKTIINSANAPAAIGPYSQAVRKGSDVYVSGQLPIDPNTGEMPIETGEQARQSLENVKHILEAAGASLDDVVKATVFLKDLADFDAVNDVYKQYFTKEYPARCCFEVSRLPKDAKVEIEVVAVMD
jgi:2-iminobutanoate/2-iminopropanoate deaminase